MIKFPVKFGIDRLKETSTWRSIVVILTAVGVALTDIQVEYIISIGTGLFGLIGIIMPDKVGGATPQPSIDNSEGIKAGLEPTLNQIQSQ